MTIALFYCKACKFIHQKSIFGGELSSDVYIKIDKKYLPFLVKATEEPTHFTFRKDTPENIKKELITKLMVKTL